MESNLDDVVARIAGPKHLASLALHELYEALSPRLFASLRFRHVSQTDAEDIVQETFLKIWTNRSTLPRDVNVPAYVWCVARNAWIDRLRKKDSIAVTSASLDLPVEQQTSDGAASLALVSCLERAFEMYRSTDPERAHVIELVAVQGLDHNDLATALGKNRGAAREYLSQARRGFSRLYEELCSEIAQ